MRFCAFAAMIILSSMTLSGQSLPGTKPLTMEGDIASTMIDGIDRFLLRELEASIGKRASHWKRDFADKTAYNKSVEPNRKRLAHLLGLRDARHGVTALRFEATTSQSHLVGQSEVFKVYAVSWPVLRDITGRGLLLVPQGAIRANVVAIPDADQTPEQVAGLTDGLPAESQFARKLAASGCQVLIPTLIDRKEERRKGRANLTSREFVHRPAYELGRHIIGYELQKVLAGVDWFVSSGKGKKIGVIGYGEGGMTALYAAAVDTRIHTACVMGYFGPRQSIWDQPIDRNVFALLEQFGDAEIATLVFPRQLIVEPSKGPEVTLKGSGGAPAKLASPKMTEVSSEVSRANKLVKAAPDGWSRVKQTKVQDGQFGSSESLKALLNSLGVDQLNSQNVAVKHLREKFDPAARQQSQMAELVRHNQWLLS